MEQLIQNYPSGQQKICKLLSSWFNGENINENNLIVGSSISFNRNTQENFLDEDFSQLRIKFEMVGNLFNELLKLSAIF